jgi:hypothetical protein
MAHNPQTPHGQAPQGNYDPAGSTQMFRAFVDDGTDENGHRGAAPSSGPRTGLIIGVAVAVVALVAVAWLALA